MPTPRPDYTLQQLAAHLGLTTWQARLAREQNLLPAPDLDQDRWSHSLLTQCSEQTQTIKSALGDQPPVGAARAAARLAARITLDVDRADIETLVISGALPITGHYQGHPVYALRDLDALDPAKVSKLVKARKGALFETVDPKAASTLLGCPKEVFDRIATEHALPTDQLGRYTLADIQQLAADPALRQRIAQERRNHDLKAAQRDLTRAEQTVQTCLQHCTAYLNNTTADPPSTTRLSRALKALTTARAAVALTQHTP